MATGGAGNGDDVPDNARHPPQPSQGQGVRGNGSFDAVSNQARVLAADFIHYRLERDGVRNVPDVHDMQEQGADEGPPMEHLREVANALRIIGDELDRDENLHRLLTNIPIECPQETFFKVATEIFIDGNFNWGRVVALFYFGYRLARRSVENAFNTLPQLLRTVIKWIGLFIRSYVAQWIVERGGWDSVVEYFGTPTRQTVGVAAVGALVTALVVWKSLK